MRLVLVLPILLAAGCSRSADPASNSTIDINAAAEAGRSDVANYADGDAGDMPAIVPTPIASPASIAPPEPGAPGGLPSDGRTGGIVSEGKFAVDSAQGAANVVQRYFALLEQGRYRAARLLWDNAGGASGMDDTAFAANFAQYSEYHAQIGAPGEIDAGAGQRYVTVPVVIYGRLKAGAAPYHAKGDVTLHHVADVDGATAMQKAWHIHTVVLQP